jgi:hypothetical protein
MIIDSPQYCGAAAVNLFANGVRTIIRYYSTGAHPTLPTKVMTKQEMEELKTAGLGISIVYENNPTHIGYFQNPTAAIDDATHAFDYADQVIGQPHGSAIFFSVDIPPSDLTDAEIAGHIIPYFQTIKSTNEDRGGNYKIGVYAAGNICQKLLTAGLADYFWYVATWDPSKAFETSGNWNLRQNVGDHCIATISCDINTINPNEPYIGHF